MKALREYSQYKYMICFRVNLDGSIRLFGSPTSVSKLETWSNVELDNTAGEDCGLFVENIFSKYFELHSKDRTQLSTNETITLSYILKYFNDTKMKLTNDLSLSLKSFQIIVVSPEFAKWNIDLLRALFLETGWITTKDSNSNSKLMLVPYIEAYLNAFQMVDTRKESFQREAKYMLLSRQTAEEKSKVIYRATCFQMQCAKELLAAGSKKLAFSDFLLVPSILGSKSICLPTIDEALLAASKRILTEFRDNYKTQHGIDMKDELSEDEVCEIATELANITPLRWNQYGEIGKVGEDVSSETLAKDQLQDLREYPIKRFLMDLTQDADVQQYTKAVCDFLQESLEESGSIKGAPDGVRRIILASGHLENQHGFCIEKALLQAKLIKPEDRFTRTNVENGMLHRPLKMAQIANALLPPLIQNEKKSDGSIFSGRPEDGNKNPLPLNSFYLQANIGERLIHFILNKVVKIPSPGNPIELFTALEKTVKMNDILTAASEIMWGHYQQLESDGHLEALITCCSEHEDINLSLGHYKCFTANLTNLINNWFQDKSAITNEELDTHQMVSINKKCSCALKITHRMLLETGLKPAVSSIAGIIVGTTLSIDHFGLYSISALFVKGGANFVDNVYCSDCLQHHLEEKLAKFFHNHHRKLVMYFVEKETEDVLKQYLVKGNYKQINGSTYAINMEIDTRESSFSFGLLNDHSSVYRDIWGIYYPARNWNASYLFKSKYTILNKGNDLPSTGFRRLFLSRWKSASVDVKISLPGHTYQVNVIHTYFALGGICSYISIDILPLHHSSAVRIIVSCFGTSKKGVVFEKSESIDIQERLYLKRH